jgi:uroporphyrinogen decarboxylase
VTGERRFLAAVDHEQPDATPVWFMRQAGRALAEYRELRERYPILTLAKTPELCADVTLMPVRTFGVDAAVLFADIMLPLEPMGVSLEIQPDVGPIIHHPIRSAAHVARLRLIEPAEDVGFVMEAIRLVRAELAGKQAVIGFSGSPFTLACYLIEGRPSRDYAIAKAFMYREQAAWHELMGKLAEVVIRYLNAQVAAGAQVVQLFDSWVGALSPGDYATYVLPHVARIFAAVRGAPTIHFGTGTAALLELMAEAGGDVIGVDARQSLDVAWGRIGFERGCWPAGRPHAKGRWTCCVVRRTGRGTSSTWAMASCPTPTPLCSPAWSSWSTQRPPDDGGEPPTGRPADDIRLAGQPRRHASLPDRGARWATSVARCDRRVPEAICRDRGVAADPHHPGTGGRCRGAAPRRRPGRACRRWNALLGAEHRGRPGCTGGRRLRRGGRNHHESAVLRPPDERLSARAGRGGA